MQDVQPERLPPGRYGRVNFGYAISINAKPEEATAPLIDWTKVKTQRKPIEIGVAVSVNMTELEKSLPILSLDDITQRPQPKNDEIER